MGVPAHWTGSSHVTQAAIKVMGSDAVSGRFHYPSNANEEWYALTGNTITQGTTFAKGASLLPPGSVVPSKVQPPPTAMGQTRTYYEVGNSVLWKLKLMGWSQYLKWLESPDPPKGSFWGRRDGTSNYPSQPAAQNSYKFKAEAQPKTVGSIGNFANYAFSADGTVTDYFLWAFLGGGTSKSVMNACPDFTSSVYFEYFTTVGTYEEKQSQLAGWPTKHLSLNWA